MSKSERDVYCETPMRTALNVSIKDVDWYKKRGKELHENNKNLTVDDITFQLKEELCSKINACIQRNDYGISSTILEMEYTRIETLCCRLRRWIIEEIVQHRG